MRGNDEIIVPGHPRWSEFLSGLSRAHICSGPPSRPVLRLAGMPDVNVEGSLARACAPRRHLRLSR